MAEKVNNWRKDEKCLKFSDIGGKMTGKSQKNTAGTALRKPPWLKIKLPSGATYGGVLATLKKRGLNTICVSGHCPNLAECWHNKTATFMILGNNCTRNCRYCAVFKGQPETVNQDEPSLIAQAVNLLEIKHTVITSVTRDDLADGGAKLWVNTIKTVRNQCPHTLIEVLIPDFQASPSSLSAIAQAKPDILGHNLETVRELFPKIRPLADYQRSLDILKYFGDLGLITKSGIMVGLSEKTDQVLETLEDLLRVNCKRATIGQYLQPTKEHWPVFQYIHPDQFRFYKEEAMKMGFTHVESGPLIRSSYLHSKQ